MKQITPSIVSLFTSRAILKHQQEAMNSDKPLDTFPLNAQEVIEKAVLDAFDSFDKNGYMAGLTKEEQDNG